MRRGGPNVILSEAEGGVEGSHPGIHILLQTYLQTKGQNMESQPYPSYSYHNFPRQFISYRWYKPILTLLLTIGIYLAFSFLIFAAAIVLGETNDPLAFFANILADLDNMDMYTASGAIMTWGGVAVILPSIAIANRIVYDRPLSSYASSRGGWNWGAFFKTLGFAALIMGVPMVLLSLFFPVGAVTHKVLFTVPGFILATLILPVQCVAEEYLCRGLLLQMFGSWFRISWIAIILQTAIFTSLHMYNVFGLISVGVMGFVAGVVTWQTKGLEASSSMHIINNLVVLYVSGFGIESSTSEISIPSFIFSLAIDIAYGVLVIIVGKRFNWFRAKKDIVGPFNAKKIEKAREWLPDDEDMY